MSALTMTISTPRTTRPPQRPSDKPDPDRIALEVLRLAADHFEKARRIEADAERDHHARDDDARWFMVAGNIRSDAEDGLVAAILATDPSIVESDQAALCRNWHPGRGVRLGDRVYLAIPDPNLEPDDEPTSARTMRLVVLDVAAITHPEAK